MSVLFIKIAFSLHEFFLSSNNNKQHLHVLVVITVYKYQQYMKCQHDNRKMIVISGLTL